MTRGPGKYDEAATTARELTGAAGVVLIVLGGSRGNGFSVQVRSEFLLRRLPVMLRDLAEQIERDVGEIAEAATKSVHVLHHGRPLCGFSETLPGEWPPGTHWVSIEEHGRATCPSCVAEAVALLER